MTRARADRGLPAAALAVGGAVVALVVGHLGRPPVLYDDAAISLRYAARLAGGSGLTYNDHERVMGFSNPLYTLLLAIADLLGASLETAARNVDLLAYAVTVGLAVEAGRRLSGAPGGVLAGGLLVLIEPFRTQALSGMEVPLATALGLGAVLAADRGRQGWAGLLLGLALFNKPDAALLALALGGGWWLVHRAPPWRMAAVALATVGPWLVVASWYFGSPVPGSVGFKLEDQTRPFDPAWGLQALQDGRVLALLVPAAVCVVLHHRRRVLAVALAGWFVLHLSALSIVDLGADYPWYLTVLYPPLAVLGGAATAEVLAPRRAGEDDDADRPATWVVLHGTLVLVVVAAVLGGSVTDLPWAVTLGVAVAAAVAFALGAGRRRAGRPTLAAIATVAALTATVGVAAGTGDTTVRTMTDDGPESALTAFERDRREAGRLVRRAAVGDEVVVTCHGWVAYENLDRPVYDPCGLNQDRPPPEEPTWVVTHGDPSDRGGNPPVAPDGFRPVAWVATACERQPGWSWFGIYVREHTDADRRSPAAPPPPCSGS